MKPNHPPRGKGCCVSPWLHRVSQRKGRGIAATLLSQLHSRLRMRKLRSSSSQSSKYNRFSPDAYPQFPRIPENTTELQFHPFILATPFSLLSDISPSADVAHVKQISFNKRTTKLVDVEVDDPLLTCGCPRPPSRSISASAKSKTCHAPRTNSPNPTLPAPGVPNPSSSKPAKRSKTGTPPLKPYTTLPPNHLTLLQS